MNESKAVYRKFYVSNQVVQGYRKIPNVETKYGNALNV